MITGAGSGVGRATAVLLDSLQWRVALVGRTPSKLAGTAALLAQEPCVIEADLSSPGGAASAARAARDFCCGRLDALVNNAGVAPREFVPESREASLRALSLIHI